MPLAKRYHCGAFSLSYVLFPHPACPHFRNDVDFIVAILQAGAALSVKVGSYSDPADLPGLAHFLEVRCRQGG